MIRNATPGNNDNGQDKDKQRLLYERLKESPHVSGLPESYDTFSSANQDSATRRKLYETLRGNENIQGIPDDFERFSSVFTGGGQDAGASGQTADGPTPAASGDPSQEGNENQRIREKLIQSLKEREQRHMDRANELLEGSIDESEIEINPRTGTLMHPRKGDKIDQAKQFKKQARQLRDQRMALLQEQEDESKEGLSITERAGDQFTKSWLRMKDIGNNIANFDNARILEQFNRIDKGELDKDSFLPDGRLRAYAEADKEKREAMKDQYRENISQNVTDIVENKNKAEDLYENPMTKAMVQADSFEEGLDLFMQNPMDAITGLAAESSLQFVPGMALGAAGGATGNPALAAGGFMLGSGSVEFGSALGEGVMEKAAEDDNTRQQVNDVLSNQGVVDEGEDGFAQFNTLKEYQSDVVSSLSDMPDDVRQNLFDTFRERGLVTEDEKDGQRIERFSGSSDEMLQAINDTEAARNFVSNNLPEDKYPGIDPSDVSGNVERARRLSEGIKSVTQDEDSILRQKMMDVIQDPEAMQEISNRAAIRGGVIGAAEGLGAVLPATAIARQVGRARAMSRALGGSGALSPSDMAKVGASATLGVGADAVAGGAGEAGAQLATGEDIRAGEVIAEAVPEAISGPFEIGSVAYGLSDNALTDQERQTLEGLKQMADEEGISLGQEFGSPALEESQASATEEQSDTETEGQSEEVEESDLSDVEQDAGDRTQDTGEQSEQQELPDINYEVQELAEDEVIGEPVFDELGVASAVRDERTGKVYALPETEAWDPTQEIDEIADAPSESLTFGRIDEEGNFEFEQSDVGSAALEEEQDIDDTQTVEDAPAAEQLAVDDIVDEVTEEPTPSDSDESSTPPPESSGQAAEGTTSAGEAAQNIARVPVSQVQADPQRFQNRDTAYSEETVQSIVEDYEQGRLNPENIPPIKVWEDPEDGNTYVVGGHSRLEAFKRLDLPDIQVQRLQNMTEQEAIEAGRIDNALGTAETIPEQAKIVRDWMQNEDMTKAEIRDRSKQLFKNNNRIVQSFAALNPSGKAIQSYQALEGNQSGDRQRAETYAKYVGEARLRNPELTDQHEEELYNYLLEHDNQNTSTQRDWLSFVDEIVQRNTFMGEFDADSPLNIKRVKPKTDAEIEFDEQVQEARQEVRDARSAFQDKVTEIEERRAEGETISEERADEVLKGYQDDIRAAERDLLRVKQQGQSVEQAKRDQSSLFGLAPRGQDAGSSGQTAVGSEQDAGGSEASEGIADEADLSDSADELRAAPDDQLQGTQMRDPQIDDQWVEDPTSLTDVINDLVETVGLTLRQGRIRMQNALGQYDEKSGVTRTRMIKSIRTVAHEAGHDIMDTFGDDIRSVVENHSGEVEELAYEGTPEGQEIDEGFAEFFRLFLLNPQYANGAAPDFFGAFNEWLNNQPDLSEGLRSIQDAYQTWLQQPSDKAAASEIKNSPSGVEKLMDDIKDRGVLGKMTDFKNKAYTAIVDGLHPIKQAVDRLVEIHEENTGERLDLKTAEDSYRLSRLTADAYTAGQMDIEFGVENYNTAKAEGPALREGLGEAFDGKWTKKNIKSFGSYLASRRLVHEWNRYNDGEIPNPPSKLSKEDHELNIQKLESEHPTYADAAEMIYEWNQNLWRKKRDAGLITDEQYMSGVENHPDYVPLQRNMEDKTQTSGDGPSATGKSGILQAFRGSDRDIMNPIESMMQDAYETAVFIKQNDAKRALLDLARHVGSPAGEIVEEIPGTQAVGFQVDPKDVLKKVHKETDWNMLGERDALTYSNAAAAIDNIDLPMVSMYKQGEINEKGEPIIYAWEDGERKALRLADSEFGVDLYEAYTDLGRENSDIISKAMAYPAQWLRAGVTTDPSFFFANLARDQVSAWILTDDFTPVLSAAEGFKSEINQDEYSRLYRSMSGVSTENVSAIDKGRVQQEIKDLRKKNIVVRRLTSIRGFFELTEISEISTRLGIFKNIRESAKERGLSDKEAALEAAYQARDYIDFGRHGSRMHATRRAVTFFNAAIQGLDKGVRVLSAEGNLKRALTPFIKDVNGRQLSNREQRQLDLSKKAWLKTAMIGTVGAGISAMFMGDEDYDEINKTYMRSTHWVVPEPSTEENEPRKWVAIPKPFELAFISNTFENAAEGVYYDDPEAFDRWMQSMYEIMAPPTRAVAAAVPVEVWANKRFFDGRPIVQERLQGLEPWKQYNSYTSDFGKWMGRQINVSPSVIDHTITGYTGSWGRSILSMTSSVGPNSPEPGWDDTWVARRFVRSADRGAFSENEFWQEMSRNEGELMSYYQTFRDLEETGTDGEALDYYEKLADWQKLYVAQNYLDVKDIIPEDEVHPMDRARNAVSALSKLRRDLRDDELFKPSKKRKLDDLLDRLGTAEYRNALVAAKRPTHENRDMMDVPEVLDNIRDVSPTFYQNYLESHFKENDLKLDATGDLLKYRRDFDERLNRYSVTTQTELQD